MAGYTIANGGYTYSYPTSGGNVTINAITTGGGYGGGGVSGTGYTLNTGAGMNGSWTNATISQTPTWDNATVKLNNDGIEIKEGADLKIGGKSLMSVLSKLEERLNILHPNPELEEKWDTLKELGEKYRALEKDILEKEKIMKILKEK